MKQEILDTISDLAVDFVYYDRKEDEQLSHDQLIQAIKDEVMTVDDMCEAFKLSLKDQLKSLINQA